MALLNFGKPLGGFSAFKTAKVPVTEVTGPGGFRAYIYQCFIKTDWDGSHRAYGLDRPDEGSFKFPHQKNLKPKEAGDKLWRSGRSRADDSWAGVYSTTTEYARTILKSNYPRWNVIGPDEQERVFKQFIDTREVTQLGRSLKDSKGKFPIVQLPGFNGEDKNKGYYVSQAHAVTSQGDYRDRPWDQRSYIDAAEVDYAVVPDLAGVRKGDYGVVIRNSTGRTTSFYCGDTAGGKGDYGNYGTKKLGEVSGHVLEYLGEGYYNEEPYSFIVFPNSGNGEANYTAMANTSGVVWARMQMLANPRMQPAHELAVRLALGVDYTGRAINSPYELSGKPAVDFRRIGRAFTYYGLNVIQAASVAKSEDDADYVAPTSMELPKK
ncbi:MAG TPA: hypothetical protein VM120_19665 [Bryobacteraceae bacterium]|nr:hypothetical protein [Bryobacteraceae bacterium]